MTKIFRKVQFYLIFLLLITLPLVFIPGNTSYGYTKTVYLVFVLGSLAVFWVLDIVFIPGKKEKKTTLTIPMLALAFVGCLSLLNSTNLYLSLIFLVIFFLLALFLHITGNIPLSTDQKFRLIYAVVFGGFVIALYASLQYFQFLVGPDLPSLPENMIASLGNKNFVAEYLAVTFPLLLASLFRNKSKLTGIIFGVILSSYLLTLSLILSWTSFLVVTISALTFGILLKRHIEPPGFERSWLTITGLTFLFLALTGLVIAVAFYPGPVEKGLGLFVSERVTNDKNTSGSFKGLEEKDGSWFAFLSQSKYQSIRMRIFSWEISRRMFLDHPLLGVGVGNYQLKYIPYKSRLLLDKSYDYPFYLDRSKRAHNDLLQLFAETGLLGIGAIVGFLIYLLRLFTRLLSRKKPVDSKLLLFGSISGLIGFFVISLFSFPTFRPESVTLFFFLGGLLVNSDRPSDSGKKGGGTPEREYSRSTWVKSTAIIVAFIFVMGLSLTCYRNLKGNVLLESSRQTIERGYFTPHQLEKVENRLKKSKRLSLLDYRQNFYLGVTNLEEENYKKAIAYLQESLNGPITERKYLLLAISHFELKQYVKARDYIDKLLSSDPHPNHKNKAFYLRAKLFGHQGNLDLAIEQIKHVIEQGKPPLQIDAYIAKAEFYLDKEDVQQAKTAYQNGKTLAGKRLKEVEEMLTKELNRGKVSTNRVIYLKGRVRELRRTISSISSRLEGL